MKSALELSSELWDHEDCVYVFVLVRDDIENYDPAKKRSFRKTMDNLISEDWREAVELIFGEEE